MAPPGGKDIPYHVRMGMICVSSTAAETLTFPIDFAKTRMQLHVGKQSFTSALMQGVRTEGIFAVYAALPPAVMRHWIYTSLRISIYEDFRNYLKDKHGLGGLGGRAIAGCSAGCIAQFFASPADCLKVILVQEGGKRSIAEVSRDIYSTSGLRGFYRGWIPNVMRAGLVNLGELSTYDQAKRKVLEKTGLPDGVIVHTMSALCSGLVASSFATPADVVKSRVMGGTETDVISCVRNTLKNEGVAAMWKGFLPNWIRLGPWQLVFWVSYEHVRQAIGYTGF